jgi:hypothetical protein
MRRQLYYYGFPAGHKPAGKPFAFLLKIELDTDD